MPRCVPTPPCAGSEETWSRRRAPSSSVAASTGLAAEENGATFLIVYGFNRSLVRYWYRPDPFRSYLNAMRLVVRLLLSLRAVGSVLPVHMLLSGERQPGFEAELVSQFGVRLLSADEQDAQGQPRYWIRVPRFSSAFHWGSFVKLAVLGLVQFRRVIVLDTDAVVFRNIDHLARAPAPSFVFRFKCWRGNASRAPAIWEMNSGFMVLRPDEALHQRMLALMNTMRMAPKDDVAVAALRNGPRGHDSRELQRMFVPSDPGDQSVWRNFFGRVHELPVAYNAFKTTAFRNKSDWQRVYVLHDPDVNRRAVIPLPSAQRFYVNVTRSAQQLVTKMAAGLGVQDRG